MFVIKNFDLYLWGKLKYIVMKKLLLILMVMFPAFTFAQIERNIDDDFNKMMQVLEDEIILSEESLMTLRIADSDDDKPVQNATIDIKNIGTYTTDVDGIVRFPMQNDGNYIFTFKKQGYITADYKFEVVAGMIYFNRFSVCKMMDLGDVRIVLDWGSSPNDLDLHLEKVGSYHISYHHKRVSDDRTAKLDRDDIDGNGPETITVTDVDDNATYYCYVHDFTNRNNPSSNKLAKSKGRITIYSNNRLEYTINIPDNIEGTRWDVFQIDNSNFRLTNRISN